MQKQDKLIVNAKELGLRLKKARENKGLSQEDLAAEVGLDQRAISEIENGKRKMSVLELPAIAEVLDVPIIYFFEDILSSSDLDNVLLQAFHDIPTLESRKLALAILRLFSQHSI